ncbi:MAG: light-harvesting antenna LH1, alpha subunit [Burkholderiales bacterium]|jgi:light-harvesting complex 1 alpha chain|nr:light-harvesting protein [Nitrosomonadaceae bacterium]
MWRIWLLFDPRRTLVAMAIFVFSMVMLLHFIVLSTDRYAFLWGASKAAPVAAQPAAPK